VDHAYSLLLWILLWLRDTVSLHACGILPKVFFYQQLVELCDHVIASVKVKEFLTEAFLVCNGDNVVTCGIYRKNQLPKPGREKHDVLKYFNSEKI